MRNLIIIITVLVALVGGLGYLLFKEFTQAPQVQFTVELQEDFNSQALRELKRYNINDMGLFPLKDNLQKDKFGQPNLFSF